MARSVPLSRFTPRVGGGSAYFVRHHSRMRQKSVIYFAVVVVLAIIAFVIAIPHFIRVDNFPSTNACINNLRVIDGAKDQWALENHKTTNDMPTWNDLRSYFPSWSNDRNWSNGMPICPNAGIYTIGKIGQPPTCSIGGLHSLP